MPGPDQITYSKKSGSGADIAADTAANRSPIIEDDLFSSAEEALNETSYGGDIALLLDYTLVYPTDVTQYILEIEEWNEVNELLAGIFTPNNQTIFAAQRYNAVEKKASLNSSTSINNSKSFTYFRTAMTCRAIDSIQGMSAKQYCVDYHR